VLGHDATAATAQSFVNRNMCAEEAAMRNRDAERLDRQIDQISNELPSGAGGFLRWLRGSSSRWVRVPVGLLLIICGVFGLLPVLGFWMAPLGVLLLAQDIPLLRRPILRALVWLERKWIKWKPRPSQ
jgi:hypothetical protein